jgi:queuine tRNA-ribosyltransferase
MKIKIITQDGLARRGSLDTGHGNIETPFFMPVATVAAMKGLESSQMMDLGAQLLLSNTYHLHLRPTSELVREAGGLHDFMNWHGPMLTDSGGFQVFSLARIRKITEEGVKFNSHIDGKEIFMGPEESMQIQLNLGADIIMAFDECKAPDTKEAVKSSMELTTIWSKQSKEYVKKMQAEDETLPTKNQQLFGIIQGSIFPELRKKSAEDLINIGFDGYAIGGLSVGEKEEVMYDMVDATLPYLPEDQPRYLMGVGTPVNIVEAVSRGVDMFDCVLPSRNARHGALYTSQGMINIRNAQYKNDFTSLDPDCDCQTCTQYTRAYLRHLLVAGEYLATPLLVRHNIAYYLNLMKNIRKSIEEGRFEEYRKKIQTTFA